MSQQRKKSDIFVMLRVVQQESDTSQKKLQQIQRLQQLETYLARTSVIEANVLLCAKNIGPNT